METKKIKNFITPLHLICGNDYLRPAMEHVYFENGFAYATNAYGIIKSSLKLHYFGDDEISFMNGKFVHRSVFAEIFKYHIVSATESGFSCLKGGVKCDFYYSDFDGKFPNAEFIIKSTIEDEDEQIDSIGINSNLLLDLQKVFVEEDFQRAVKLIFKGKNKGILVLPNGEDLEDHKQIGVLMPVKLN